jgi:type IV pilus assembly protein PilB
MSMKQKIFNFKKNLVINTELVGEAAIQEAFKTDILNNLDQNALNVIPYALALELCILPIGYQGHQELEILCLNTNATELLQKLNFILNGQKFKLRQWDGSQLREAIFRAYKGQSTELQKIANKIAQNAVIKNPKIKDIDFHLAKSDSAKFLIALIEYAYAQEVSDVHFLPESNEFRVKLRKDGEFLVQQESINDLQVYKQIIQRIKALAGLDLAKSHLPQDGAFSLNILDQKQSVRVSSMPTIHGEKIVLRIFSNRKIKSLKMLGFNQDFIDLVRVFLTRTGGLIIVCGSTGSGKTTTLYAMLNECNTWQKNIVSLEDPVEQEIAGVTQTAINVERQLTYPLGLKAILRQDPDIILIGEMRDSETFKTALEASFTGHIILTSLHAQSLKDIVARFDSAGVNENKLNQSLLLMISQKLLPKLCAHCKVVDESASSLLNHKVFKANIHKAEACKTDDSASLKNCKNCDQNGYAGRVLLWEAYSPEFSEQTLQLYSYQRAAYEALKNGELSYQQVREFTVST